MFARRCWNVVGLGGVYCDSGVLRNVVTRCAVSPSSVFWVFLNGGDDLHRLWVEGLVCSFEGGPSL